MKNDMTSCETAKRELRARIRAERKARSAADLKPKSEEIERQAIRLPEFSRASVVACYMSLKKEVATDAILAECYRAGMQPCVPALNPDTGSYGFCEIHAAEEMVIGQRGVREPGARVWVPLERIDVFFVPGVAFDGAGGRVGHGGGHYDRLLAEAFSDNQPKVGLAFEFQIFDEVPAVEHDVRMNIVVTEKRVIRCGATDRRKSE